jgi:hypothetical protein
MRELVNLRYSGSQIKDQDGMDAYDAAEAIDGFSDFLNSIAQSVYGQDYEVRPTLSGVREGSLDLPFIVEFVGVATTIISSGAPPLDEVIKKAFELFKHLKGQPAKSIKATDGGVAVENNTGSILVVNNPTYNLIFNGDAASSAERFARKPLQKQADNLDISVNGKLAASAHKDSADSFKPVGDGEKLAEFFADQYLTIQTVVLEGDGNWRFTDGRNKFRAEIEDKEFLQRIKDGRERFGRGDILRVRLRSRQEKVRGQLKTVHVVEKVLGHEPHKVGQLNLI